MTARGRERRARGRDDPRSSVVVAREKIADDDADSESGDGHYERVVASGPVDRLPPPGELLADAPALNARVVQYVFHAPSRFLREILPSLAGVREALAHRTEDVVNP